MGRGLAAARRRVPLPVFRGSPWWRAKREGVDGKEGRKKGIDSRRLLVRYICAPSANQTVDDGLSSHVRRCGLGDKMWLAMMSC